MSKRTGIIVSAIAGIFCIHPGIAQEDTEKLDQEAERLRILLENAAASGYVSMRGEANDSEDVGDSTTSAAESGIKSRSLRFDDQAGQVQSITSCSLADVFDFDAFKESPTYDDIFKLRNDLVSIRGVYDPVTGLQLAKSYLALAMPEEAISLTKLLSSDDVQLAGQMARVLSGAEESSAGEMEKYIQCTDRAGLWTAAALSRQDASRAIEYTEEYITEIGQLPADLQFFFSTQLGILAAEQEEYELARELLKKALKLDRNDDTAVLYLESLIGNGAGKQADLQKLKQVAQTQGPLQAKALFALGEESESTPYKSYATDLELVSAQYRGMSESDVAKQMNVRFLAEESRYQQAIDFSLQHFPAIDANRLQVRDSIASVLLKRLRSSDDTERFHSLNSYSNNIVFFDGFPDETALRFSAIETALHFELPHLLDPLMEGHDFSALQREIDYAVARSALMNGRPDSALSICSLYEGDTVCDNVSVDAAVAMNDPKTALTILARLPQTNENAEKSAAIAWQFGLWGQAKDHYADVLVTAKDTASNDRYNLAAYMSGELGGFFALRASADLLEIESLFESYKQERPKLTEYLANG